MEGTVEVNYTTYDTSVEYERLIHKEDLGRWLLDQFDKAREEGYTFRVTGMYDGD